jgi:hypothetical protein
MSKKQENTPPIHDTRYDGTRPSPPPSPLDIKSNNGGFLEDYVKWLVKKELKKMNQECREQG